MPTDAQYKPRSIHVVPSNPGSSSRTLRRSRVLAVLAILLVWFLWRRLHNEPKPSGLPINYDAVDWSKYAYSQYATNGAYLCNSIMVFEALHRLGSRADRILFYPAEFDTDIANARDRDSQLLVIARDIYKVKIIPMNMQSVRAKPPTEEESEEIEEWDFSINKFFPWNQTQYERILHFDSDVTVLKNMDELFFLPDTGVAMPRAYWQLPEHRRLTSMLILLKPSRSEYEYLMHSAFTSEGQIKKFDMELLNEQFGDSAMVLPHRQYGLLTGEFRKTDHSYYLGNDYEAWDPHKILEQASLVHFSDWPLPKPWVMWPSKLLAEILPKCTNKPGTPEESGCGNRDVWKGLYDDFRQRRKVLCPFFCMVAMLTTSFRIYANCSVCPLQSGLLHPRCPNQRQNHLIIHH
jgi:alpha-N-acetylglucosamine transferase